MARSGQRTAPYKLPLYSASQYKQLDGCQRRWGFNRILKLEEPQSKKAALGSKLHEECEAWLKLGVLPRSEEAQSAIKLGPAPHTCLVETPVRFDLAQSSWVGYVDAVYGWRLDAGPVRPSESASPKTRAFGKPPGRPTADMAVVVIHDWKFTSSWEYALNSESLHTDFAANVYAYDAFQGGASRVFCRWVYTLFDGQTSKEVWSEMDRELGEQLLKAADEKAATANFFRQEIQSGRMDVLDLEYDTSHCFDFRSTCPRKGVECKPVKTSGFKLRSKTDMESFEAETAANFGAIKKPLPPLPGQKKPLPPPPPKATPAAAIEPAAVLAPEKGFVNPSDSPLVEAPNSPEEAVESGNVYIPGAENASEPDDDLSDKSIEELRKIAAAIGAVHAPKARSVGVIAAIRARRAELEMDGQEETPIERTDADAAVSALEDEMEQQEEFTAEVAAAVAKQKAALEDEDAREERVTEDSVIKAAEVLSAGEMGAVLRGIANALGCRITLTFDADGE